MKEWLKKFLVGFVEPEIYRLAQQLIAAEQKAIREILTARRIELASSTPVAAIQRLIDKLEKEENKRNEYAEIVWRIAKHLSVEELQMLKAEVAALENR